MWIHTRFHLSHRRRDSRPPWYVSIRTVTAHSYNRSECAVDKRERERINHQCSRSNGNETWLSLNNYILDLRSYLRPQRWRIHWQCSRANDPLARSALIAGTFPDVGSECIRCVIHENRGHQPDWKLRYHLLSVALGRLVRE